MPGVGLPGWALAPPLGGVWQRTQLIRAAGDRLPARGPCTCAGRGGRGAHGARGGHGAHESLCSSGLGAGLHLSHFVPSFNDSPMNIVPFRRLGPTAFPSR